MSTLLGRTAAASTNELASPAAAESRPQRLFVLTTSCPDTTGIVAAVAGFPAASHCLITEAQHHDDLYNRMSFMRTVFHDNGQGMPSLEALDRQFAEEVGRRFRMGWHFHEAERRCRTLIAVSRQGHCLNSILHRWSTGTLPIEVVGVASTSGHEEPCRMARRPVPLSADHCRPQDRAGAAADRAL